MKNLITIILLIALTAFVSIAGTEKPECDAPVYQELCQVRQGLTLNLPASWKPVAAADFNKDGYPDLLLYNEKTGETFIWYLQPIYN